MEIFFNVCTLYWNISLSSFFQSAEVAVKYVNNANVTLPLFLKNCREKKVYIYKYLVITTCQQLDKGLAVTSTIYCLNEKEKSL